MSTVDPLAVAAKFLSPQKVRPAEITTKKMFSRIGYQPEKLCFVHYIISFRTSFRWAAATICPRPVLQDLQVPKKYKYIYLTIYLTIYDVMVTYG